MRQAAIQQFIAHPHNNATKNFTVNMLSDFYRLFRSWSANFSASRPRS